MAELKLVLQVRLPFWWRPYVRCAAALAWLGVPLDPDRIGHRIARRARLQTVRQPKQCERSHVTN